MRLFSFQKKTAPAAKPAAPRPVAPAIAGDAELGGLGRALWQKRMRIVIPTLAVAAATFFVVNSLTPRYKSETRVLLESKENVFLRAEADKNAPERAALDPEAVTSQLQLVLSRDLARSVIKKEGLSENPEFGSGSLMQSILGMFGLGRDPGSMSPDDRVLEGYYSALNVYAVERSRVIVIEFRSADPELAARVANTVADTYLSMQQSAKQDQTRAASSWLSNEIASMREKVAEAESKIEDYRARSNLFVGSNNTSLPNQQLTEINSQISAARTQKADLEARAKQLRELLRSNRTIDSSDIANSDSMRRLSEQRAALSGQLAEQSSTLLDQHPRIKELKAQIGDIDRQMRSEAERLSRALDNDAKVAGNRIESLTASLDQVKKLASTTNEQDLQLRALEREGKAQRDLLESYLAKYREASARENINAAPPDARVISRATPAIKPDFPKKTPIMVIATLAAFMLSSGLIITGELLTPSVYSAYPQVAQNYPPPVYAPPAPSYVPPTPPTSAYPVPPPPIAVPAAPALDLSARVARIVPTAAVAPVAAVSTAGQSLDAVARTLRAAGEGGRRIAVTGSGRNAGTTFAAITLARALAKEATVILVDLAFASPNLSVISTDPNAPGIAELVRGTASFGNAITRDQFSAVHLIATGNAGAEGASIAASPALAANIEALARAYDHVVLDTGAVTDIAPEYFALLSPRAVLITDNPAGAATIGVKQRLTSAGFADVAVVAGGASAAAA